MYTFCNHIKIHTYTQSNMKYFKIQELYLLLYSRVSGQTVRPRRDLSHPARTKKQIDASSRYNSPPPLPSVDMPISAGHRTTNKTSFIIRARRPRPLSTPFSRSRARSFIRTKSASCMRIFSCFLLWRRWLTRAIRWGEKRRGKKRRKFAAEEEGFRFLNLFTRPRVTVCARIILHTIARTKSVTDLRTLVFRKLSWHYLFR